MLERLNTHATAPWLMIGGTVAVIVVVFAVMWLGLDMTNVATE